MSITIALVDDDRNILTSLSVTLQSEGFIEIGRGKGIRVKPLSSTDLREMYQLISGIEVAALGLEDAFVELTREGQA